MRRDKLAAVLTAAASAAGAAHALPINPQVAASSGGAPTITPGANTLTIDQTAERVVLDWDSFAIAPGESVTFNLPDGAAIAVNRVPFCSLCSVPPPMTIIEGALLSNGNVWVLDPRGVFFGATAQVDVHGLLASPAALLDINAFVGGALGDPIAFQAGGGGPVGPVSVGPGAQIVVRGGPALFVGAVDPDNAPANLAIAGSVTGGGTTAEQASSQILYGAAQSFTLRFSATPPNPMNSSDLQLFDFIVDGAVSRSSVGQPIDLVTVLPGSTTRAGSVFVAGAAQPLRDPANPDDPVLFHISAPLESTSGPLVLNGAGGIANKAAAGSLIAAEIDIVLDRGAFETPGPAVVLGPLVDLRSAGGIDIAGRSIQATQRASVMGQFPAQPVPDHLTVQFSNNAQSATPAVVLRARDDIFLQNTTAIAAGTAAQFPMLSAGFGVTVQNSLGNPTFGAINAGGAIVIRENMPVNGGSPGPPVNFTLGALTAGLTQPGGVAMQTRGSARTGAIAGDDVVVRGDALVMTGDIAVTGSSINLASATGSVTAGALTGPVVAATAGGDVSIGAVAGQSLRLTAGGASDVRVIGSISLSSGPTGQPALEIVAGDAVTLNGVVTSQRDVLIAAGGIFTSTAPIQVTAASGPGMTSSGIATFGGFDLRAADVSLGDTLSVRGAGGVGVNIAAPGAGGIGLGDGALAATLRLSNSELQKIDAPFLTLRASLGGAGDLLLGDFTVDAAQLGLLALIGRDTVRFAGVARGVGAPPLKVGEGTVIPARIEITGAVGTLANPFGAIGFDSNGPILIGTPMFVTALQGANLEQVDLTQFGVGFGGVQANQLFLVSDTATFSTTSAILQQNSGGIGFDGVRFAAPANAGVFDGAPTRIALFGRFTDRGGVVVTGVAAALIDGLLEAGVAPSDSYRINGCVIGQMCANASASDFDPVSLRSVPGPQGDVGPDRGQRASGGPKIQARRAANATNAAIEVGDGDTDLEAPDEAREDRDPGVGAANEDLWPVTR